MGSIVNNHSGNAMIMRSASGRQRTSAETTSRAVAARRTLLTHFRSLAGRVQFFLCSDDEGGALVEMAMAAPILLLLVSGAFTVMMGLYSYQQVNYAAFTAAETLGAGRGIYTDPCAQVVTSVTGGLPGYSASKMTFTVTIDDSSGTAHTYGPTAGSGFSCAAGAAEMAPNEPVTVKLSYSYSWFPAFGLNWGSGNLVSSETVMVD